MNKFIRGLGIAFAGAAVCGGIMYAPTITRAVNNYFHSIREADDETNYKTKKKVEDTCRSMISSYEADKLTYEQYKDSDDKNHQIWGEQAKIRANRTASSYNNYILKNNYVWSDNVPNDIRDRLEIIE